MMDWCARPENDVTAEAIASMDPKDEALVCLGFDGDELVLVCGLALCGLNGGLALDVLIIASKRPGYQYHVPQLYEHAADLEGCRYVIGISDQPLEKIDPRFYSQARKLVWDRYGQQ